MRLHNPSRRVFCFLGPGILASGAIDPVRLLCRPEDVLTSLSSLRSLSPGDMLGEGTVYLVGACRAGKIGEIIQPGDIVNKDGTLYHFDHSVLSGGAKTGEPVTWASFERAHRRRTPENKLV